MLKRRVPAPPSPFNLKRENLGGYKVSIFKVKKRETPFVQIDKTAIMDSNLSWKATGILAYLLSRPDDWQVYENEIVRHAKDGRDSVRSGIQELIDQGYIFREERRSELGRFKGYDYSVYEVPHRVGLSNNGKPDIGEPATTNNYITNKDITNKDKRYTVTSNDGYVVKSYISNYKNKFNKSHPSIRPDQLDNVLSFINDAESNHNLDNDEWDRIIASYFNELSGNNDGNILGFASGDALQGVIRRYV